MSIIPTELAEISKIIYEERLQEAEQYRRAAALTSASSRSWSLNLSKLFKSKADKPGRSGLFPHRRSSSKAGIPCTLMPNPDSAPSAICCALR